MAYAGTELLYPCPPLDQVRKFHPAGICASFTFDWLKKIVARKPLGKETYASTKRLKKMTKRHKKYETINKGLEPLAELYGLQVNYLKDCSVGDGYVDDFKSFVHNLDPDNSLLYISLQPLRHEDTGHALGYHKKTNTFCDANLGIMDLQIRNLSSVIQEAIYDVYETDYGKRIFDRNFSIYNVALKK